MKEEKQKTGKRREIEGVVVSNHMQNTVKVRVNTFEKHPVYKKVVKRKKIFFARTQEPLNIGDEVKIRESRPLSKKVRWVVVKKD